MDYWRDYFGGANSNIFDVIEKAILLAASDFPKEFKIRRDGIAQILFNCKLIKCSACDKQELALPVLVDNHNHNHNHNDDDDHHNDGVKYTNVNAISRIDDDDDDDDDDVKVNNNYERNRQVSTYSYEDAEALTDELEQESQTFGEVMRIKHIVDNSPYESASVLCNSLRKLQLMAISVETLKATEIGKSVNVLRKHALKEVRQIARTLIEMWKDMVDEWVNATTKMTVSEATPESLNPSVVDEEEGLPSPPLDDLAFLNPHSMSLELNEFFDGMDDYGNPRNNGGKPIQRNNGGKPPVEKQNLTKWKQQKPSNGPTMVPKPSVVKPCKPPVAESTPGAGRLMKPNMDRKLQNPEKTTPLKRPVAPQQRKPMSSNEETTQDKLEATKRKLQERYKQAENAKRQRTIQVMELQDLPKQSITSKNQHIRPGNNHNRNWEHGRH